MGKFCTNCGNELDQNTNICLKCGVRVDGTTDKKNGKKKKGLPTWAIILIVLGCVVLIPIILLTIFAIVGFKYIEDNNIDIEKYIEDFVEEYNDFDVKKGNVNDTLEADDLFFTLNKYAKYSEIGESKANEGKEYLVLFFDVENKDDERKSVSSLDFNGYVDGYAVESSYLTTDVDGKASLDNYLVPGMKASGYVAFEVSTSWKNFEVHYNHLFDDELVFKIVNDDSNKQGA